MAKFGIFVLLYSFMKLIRIMIAAAFLMTAAVIICRIGGFRTWRLNLGILALVPAACLMSYSKVFYVGKLMLLTNWLDARMSEKMAVLYFGIAGILAVRFCRIHICLRRSLRHMEKMPYEECSYGKCSVKLLQSAGPVIQVYLSEDDSGPFAGGIFRPYIVIPKRLKNSLLEEEWDAVLCHEALHIRQGHVLILNIYALLKILWWIHPLVYICDWKLRENIEYSSDEGSVMLGSLSAYGYAGVILKALQMQKQGHPVREGITTFSEDNFELLKRRVERLGTVHKGGDAVKDYGKKKRILRFSIAAAAVSIVSAVAGTSFPRYTKIEDIAAYDETLRPLTYDLAEEGFQAEIKDGQFRMTGQEFERFVSAYGLRGEYVIFSYDTIMKLPGVGGLGQAAAVSMSNPSCVNLLARQEWMDDVALFVLKFLI